MGKATQNIYLSPMKIAAGYKSNYRKPRFRIPNPVLSALPRLYVPLVSVPSRLTYQYLMYLADSRTST
jgi:hypothetical protein